MIPFSIKEALTVGWTKTKQNFWLWAGIVITMGIVNSVLQKIGDNNHSLELVSGIIRSVLQLILELGVITIALKLLDDHVVTYSDLFSAYKLTGQGLIAGIVSGVAIGIGIILLVIPGIYIALRLSLTMFLVVDKRLPGIEAIKQSWALTRGYEWQLFLLTLTLVVMNIGGALLILLGLFVTIPISALAMAHVYRTISQRELPVVTTPTTTP